MGVHIGAVGELGVEGDDEPVLGLLELDAPELLPEQRVP